MSFLAFQGEYLEIGAKIRGCNRFQIIFQAQFYGGRFKEEEVQVVDFAKNVFGLFIDALYGQELA